VENIDSYDQTEQHENLAVDSSLAVYGFQVSPHQRQKRLNKSTIGFAA